MTRSKLKIHFPSEADVRAVVAVKWRLHGVVGIAPEEIGENAAAFVLLFLARVIEQLANVPAPRPFAGEFRVERIVELDP
jgi:hypothetical protein